MTGSSLTLGAAGSRRTVYLVDENPKLPDTSAQSDSELGSNNRNNTSISNNNSSVSNSSSTNNNNNHSSSHDQSPSTFLMYNRISNVIGDPTQMAINSNNQQSPASSVINDNANKDKKKPNDEHVWYEYGCV